LELHSFSVTFSEHYEFTYVSSVAIILISLSVLFSEVPSENSEIKQRLAESQAEAQARIMEIEKQLHDVKKTGIPIRQQ
jgi:hypothetical protein